MSAARPHREASPPPSRLALEALYDRQRAAEAAEEMSEQDVDQFLSRIRPATNTLPDPGDGLDAARGMVWGLALSVPLWGAIATLLVAMP